MIIFDFFLPKYLVIQFISCTFATKLLMMVEVHHNNKEIESLVFINESTLYKELLRKKAFLKAMRTFYSILEVIDNIRDLMRYYTFLQYQRKELSSVLIVGTGVSKRLIFSEHEDGQSIKILELI